MPAIDELPKTYTASEVERKWYAYWLTNNLFHSEPDGRPAYSVVIPPPNVTGILHMGHMLNNTIQDVLVRRKRMQGYNVTWVPGTDHASIATEAKVVKMLADKGIAKKDLTRDQFLEHAWAWKEEYGGTILRQLERMGCSCDWERTKFTMDPTLSQAVTEVFVDLYSKGLIYRGVRMVNWDPVGLTAVSDEEVIYKEEQSTLFYVEYHAADGAGDTVTVATTRPETILADVAIAVHPNDPRYADWVGREVIVPLSGGRTIPIITDEAILLDFGTGCLKVTPAHDLVDYEIGRKHNLEVIDLINNDGTLNERAGAYAGMDRFIARKVFAKDLEAAGQLAKREPYTNRTGRSERTDAVIEPKLSLQWFVKMGDLAKPALEAVVDGRVTLHPNKFMGTYRHWMENVRDWCISRQLWWGHRIPAWYSPDGTLMGIGRNAEEAALMIERQNGVSFSPDQLKQDEDCLDTWFSSWLWPISVFDPAVFNSTASDEVKRGNEDLRYYYPTTDLVTAPEILFFWVARMIMAGIEYRGEVPFKNVYLTGIVRDKQGRKMSKSLGNSPDLLELIEKHGADGVRVGMLFSSPAGNDLLFDESQCEQGRNFANKMWNALRLVMGWTPTQENLQLHEQGAVSWFRAKLDATLAEIETLYESYRLSDALLATYKLIWDDFCSSFLELMKAQGETYQLSVDGLAATKHFFEELMRVVHPFMPHLSEEIWQTLGERKDGESICLAPFPTSNPISESDLQAGEAMLEAVNGLRGLRSQHGISPKAPLNAVVNGELMRSLQGEVSAFVVATQKLGHAEQFIEGEANSNPKGWSQLLLGRGVMWVDTTAFIDPDAERAKLEKELAYQQNFLENVQKKLDNEKFMAGAPEAVRQIELTKKSDTEAKIAALRAQIDALSA